MAVVLRALTLLGLMGASCAMFVQELMGDWTRQFVTGNVMTLPNRTRLLVGMAAGAAAAILIGLLVLWRKDTRRLRRLAYLLSPLILIGLVPQLTDAAAWSNPLDVGLVVGGFVLLIERLFRMAWLALAETPPGDAAIADGYPPWWKTALPPRLRRWLPALLVVAGAIGYGIYFFVFMLCIHEHFQTYNFNLNQYNNLF